MGECFHSRHDVRRVCPGYIPLRHTLEATGESPPRYDDRCWFCIHLVPPICFDAKTAITTGIRTLAKRVVVFLAGVGNAAPYIVSNVLIVLPIGLTFMGFSDMTLLNIHDLGMKSGVPAVRRERPLFTTPPK
jgi:hypothetical protein